MHVNSVIFKWACVSVSYLLSVVTWDIIKPQSLKVEAIIGIEPPNKKYHLIHFIGVAVVVYLAVGSCSMTEL